MKRTQLQPFTGWLPKWVKDLLMRLGVGDCLIEYCNECGRLQPLVWWCRDNALWREVNGGSEGGALCPACFNMRASKLGHFIRWYPEASA